MSRMLAKNLLKHFSKWGEKAPDFPDYSCWRLTSWSNWEVDETAIKRKPSRLHHLNETSATELFVVPLAATEHVLECLCVDVFLPSLCLFTVILSFVYVSYFWGIYFSLWLHQSISDVQISRLMAHKISQYWGTFLGFSLCVCVFFLTFGVLNSIIYNVREENKSYNVWTSWKSN